MTTVTVTNPNHDAHRPPETTEHPTLDDALGRVDELVGRYRLRGCTVEWHDGGRIVAHDHRRAFTDVVIEVRTSEP